MKRHLFLFTVPALGTTIMYCGGGGDGSKEKVFVVHNGTAGGNGFD